MVWLRLINLPEHHYCEETAKILISSFGKLERVNHAKVEHDLHDIEIMIEVMEMKDILYLLTLHYDGVFTQVSVKVITTLDFHSYRALELDEQWSSMSYTDACEVADRYRAYQMCIYCDVDGYENDDSSIIRRLMLIY